MERFTPDVFLEWLLRPLLMADPSAFLYVEFTAPDLRPAFLLALTLIGLAFGSLRARLTAETWRLMIAFWLSLYLWTFVSGNGRYFLSALVLLGPLLVLAWRGWPGTNSFRWSTLLLLGGLQAAALASTYQSNVWGRVDWAGGPAIDIEDGAVRHRPAAFIVAGGNAYSMLVPRFHPESRWMKIVGQHDMSPAAREYASAVEVLSGPLPRLLVIPLSAGFSDRNDQPGLELRLLLGQSLSNFGLTLTGEPCSILRSALPRATVASAVVIRPGEVPKEPVRGFWFCPMVYSDAGRLAAMAKPPSASQWSDVFAAIEQRCPRFFPPGGGVTREFEDMASRWYPSMDTLISVRGPDLVSYKYYRSLNPRSIGSVADIRAGRFAIQCDKPPGRYRMPWSKEETFAAPQR
jgi:hypothetical protein